jgi:glutathione S-transferase
MRLYYVPRTRSLRPRWVLEELGVPYELVRLDPAKGETRTAEHLARHPLGHVPVLDDGGVLLFESAAICLHLADRFPDGGLAPPPGTPERGRLYQWAFFAMTEIEPALVALEAEHRKPAGGADEGAVEAARARFGSAAGALERALAGRTWLVGSSFSVADVVCGATLLWARGMKLVAGLPAVEAYVGRLRDRPALRRALAD